MYSNVCGLEKLLQGGGGGRGKLTVPMGNKTKTFFDEHFRKLQKELVLPFLWAQDGFDQPSESMAKSIRMGLDIPVKLPMLAG